MFNYKKSGKGVINGKWVVFFIDENGDSVNMFFTDHEEIAFQKAKYYNDLVKSFISLIRK